MMGFDDASSASIRPSSAEGSASRPASCALMLDLTTCCSTSPSGPRSHRPLHLQAQLGFFQDLQTWLVTHDIREADPRETDR
jgi:hypothetical protein